MAERTMVTITSADEEWCRARFDQVFALAVKLHAKQTDRAGVSYIVHLHYVATRQGTYAGRVIALLHDSIEDDRTTAQGLRNVGVPESIIQRIELLSRPKGMDYLEYILIVRTDHHTAQVKKADLEHNMDLTRLKSLNVRDLERSQLYHQAYRLLQENKS